MTPIYAIRNAEGFQEIDLEVDDILNFSPDDVSFDDVLEFHLRSTPMKPWWKTPVTDFISASGDRHASIPDISHWIDSGLILSPKAFRLLGEKLAPSGEFLPILVDNETYYLFNCFAIGNADEDKCEYEYHEGMKLGITHLEFNPDAAENLIWKTPADSCITLFCGDQFKEIVESFRLTGLWFDTKLVEFSS